MPYLATAITLSSPFFKTVTAGLVTCKLLYSFINNFLFGVNIKLSVEKEKVKYFGKFTVTDVQTTGNQVNLILSDTKYSGTNFLGNSIDLKIGDILVNKNGMSKFQINEIESANLSNDEYEELLKQRDVYRNSEKIYSNLNSAYQNLYDGSVNSVSKFKQHLTIFSFVKFRK